jgi:hypothetical protein
MENFSFQATDREILAVFKQVVEGFNELCSRNTILPTELCLRVFDPLTNADLGPLVSSVSHCCCEQCDAVKWSACVWVSRRWAIRYPFSSTRASISFVDFVVSSFVAALKFNTGSITAA